MAFLFSWLPIFIEATMAKDTQENPTSVQTGTTPNPFASNTQDYSESDDEILDNFADGPDDGIPLGVGGEKGKQSEPASSTLEADILSGGVTTEEKETPGEDIPPEDTADDTEPDQGAVSETGKDEPPSEPTDSTEPEFPPMLLQMAGYADAEAAKADGLGTPEALNAFIRGRGQLLSSQPSGPPSEPDGAHPYKRPESKEPPAPAKADDSDTGEFKPFELNEDEVEMLDETLQDTIRRMNEHNQRQFDALRQSQMQREEMSAEQKAEAEVQEFDKAIQSLGDEWQDVFGEGNYSELMSRGRTDPNARIAMEYRRELFDTVQSLRDVNAQRGFESMDLQREIGFGLMQRFPDKFQQLVSSGKSNGKQRRTPLNRPTQRRAMGAKKDELISKLHKKYPDAGFDSSDDEFEGEI